MSRYLLLVLFNIPIILLACTGIITRYKMRKITKKRATGQVVMWLTLLVALALASPVYSFLFDRNLTDTESLSLFDVVQLTLIVFLLYTVNKLTIKHDKNEQRLDSLHKQLSITLSKIDTEPKKKS